MKCALSCTSCGLRSTASASGGEAVRPHGPMDGVSSRSFGSLAGRRMSNYMASTTGRDTARIRGRSRLQVTAALFEPPPFKPGKLSVQYLPGAAVNKQSSQSGQLSLPQHRRYTLTHNDITGALQLSIGADYNQKQVQGFYTRILRDEITAEWLFSKSSSTPAELHIYCHVSGEEKWLAPPQLRNFIFRREMTLVLDTFVYADSGLLQSFPHLLFAKVYVHFQSDVQDLDLREYWGVLGERASWRRMPKGVLARLKLLLFGFPALPHQRPRHALTQQQQQQQKLKPQQVSGVLVPADVAAVTGVQGAQAARRAAQHTMNASGSADSQGNSSPAGHHHWQPQAELAVDSTRPVALSLEEQRNAALQQQQHQNHPTVVHDQLQQAVEQPPAQHGNVLQQQQQADTPHSASTHSGQVTPLAGASGCTLTAVHTSKCCEAGSKSADLHSNECVAGWHHQQHVQQPLEQSSTELEQQKCLQQCLQDSTALEPQAHSSVCSQQHPSDSGSQQQSAAPLEACQSAQQHVKAGQQQQQPQVQEQIQQWEQATLADVWLEYGRWSARDAQGQEQAAQQDTNSSSQLVAASIAASSRGSGGVGGSNGIPSTSLSSCSSSNVLPAGVLVGQTALQLPLPQQQQQMLLHSVSCAAVVVAAANAVAGTSSAVPPGYQ